MDDLARPALPVVIHQLRRVFDTGVVGIEPLDLSIPAGQFIAILGPSGCGKSTLLRIIAGLDHPTTGTVSFGDASRRRFSDLAYVFQDAHLLPWRTVLDNVALPLELMGSPKRQRIDAARQAIRDVGLADALLRYPAQLSGGMRMRVSLARALVTQPRLLLLDEPFAALDEITRNKLDEQLRSLWLARQMTVVFVTHSTTEAVFLADRAIVLTARPAKLVADIPLILPRERTAQLRGEPEFARQTQAIYQALELGSPP